MNDLIKGIIADIQSTAIRDKAAILTIPNNTDAYILFADGSHQQITIEVLVVESSESEDHYEST